MSRRKSLDDAILSIDAKLTSIRAREEEARNLYEFIAEQRRALEAERALLEEQRSPFSHLPTELIIQIFLSFVQERDEVDARDIRTYTFYYRPVVLSHVSRRWRAIALSTSSLWSCILFRDLRSAAVFIHRSKGVPLDIVGAIHSGDTRRPLNYSVVPYLEASRSRWRTVSWKSSSVPESLSALLIILNCPSFTFPLLETLELSQTEDIIYIKEEKIPLLYANRATSLPILRHLHLVGVALADIPPYLFSGLRTLDLSFPNITHSNLRMSNLCALLSRTPNLVELRLNDAIPMMDIRVCVQSEGDAPPFPALCHYARTAPSHINPIFLPRLRQLEWSFAPPADIWLLFYFISVPSLYQMELCLNADGVRWVPTTSQQSWSPGDVLVGEPRDSILHLTHLEELSIECFGPDGLTKALKKFGFPALKKLRLTYIPALDEQDSSLPKLPRLESIFREPRLPTLTHLMLSHFQLDKDDAKTMLKYMQSLTHLTFNACSGAGAVVCSLSGGSCTTRHVNPLKTWICPRLEDLALIDCRDVKFRCLNGMVSSRKLGSTGLGCDEPEVGKKIAQSISSSFSDTAREPRPMKPLKKRYALPSNSVKGLSAAETSSSPSSAEAATSLFPGWNPYAILKPSCLTSVHVEGCLRISKVEAMSLQECAVSTVTWHP